jgi:hypothetical protein
VFDMIAQIKALKMSVVFNTKMGTLYWYFKIIFIW